MRNYAVIESGVVTNVIYADDNFTSNEIKLVLLDDIMPVGIGDTYDGEHFYHEDGTIVRSLYEELQDKYADLMEKYLELSIFGSE